MERIRQIYSLTIIIAGDFGVGKTNIVYSYTKKNISSEIEPTNSKKFFFKNTKIKGKKIRLQIWELSGQEELEEINIKSLCSKCHGGFIIYDISQKESFDNVDFWYSILYENLPEDSPIILLGNKSDLDSERKIPYEDGVKKSEELSISFYETCALDKENINNVFNEILKQIIEKMEKDKKKPEVVDEEENKKVTEINEEILLQKKEEDIDERIKEYNEKKRKGKNGSCACC